LGYKYNVISSSVSVVAGLLAGQPTFDSR